jgi:penicillin-binding protein 2
MEKTKLTIRLAVLGLLTAALAFAMGGRLLGMQVLYAETYIQGAVERTTFRTVTLHAARGEIYDRYGRPLVTNKLSYNLQLDHKRIITWNNPAGEREAADALALIRAARECGVAYSAELLPVTMPPFVYTEMTAAQKRYLEHYLDKKGWPAELTAPELMDRLFDDFGMSGEAGGIQGLIMPVYEARLIAGVLYELDLRYQAERLERDRNTNEITKPYLHVPEYTFAQDVPIAFITRVKENKWRGAEIVPVTAREYNTSAAGHILGRIGPIQDDLEGWLAKGYREDELVGVEGVERAFEHWLHGTAGERVIEYNAQGIIVGVTDRVLPQAGRNVYLTIDIHLQEQLERTLAEGVKALNRTGVELRGLEAEAAAAVLTNPNTGEVLAAANYPTYDPRNYMRDYAELAQDELRPLFNRAVFGTYAPGSAYKMVTAAAAIEGGIVTPSTQIFDEGIYTFYQAPQPRCYIYPGSHGRVDAAEAIKVSCNYYFYDIGRRAGIDSIAEWAALFGFGQPTGFELEGADRTRLGWVASPETAAALNTEWWIGNTLSSAIGQENNQVTPMQLANYTAAIANGGTLYKAHLLKEVLSFDYSHESFIARPTPIREITMAPSTVKALQQGMLGATQLGGTAYNVFRDFPIPVAGKTGSVQVGSRANNGVFICYAPYDDPQIALALVVEKGGAGSTVAPIARDILDLWFTLQEDMANDQKEYFLTR